MFSSRTSWNTVPNRLYSLIAEKRSRGESIIDLTESNPTRCGFSYPKQEILGALTDESALVYEPQSRGLLSARVAIAQYYSTQCIQINPEQIILTSSTSEAYSFLFKLLCDTGDRILAPRPSYPLFEYLCQLSEIELRGYRLTYDGEWRIDFSSLKNELSDRTRAIVLINPNNPTGSYLKQEEYDRICNLANEHHCAIIVDEVFGSYAFSQDNQRSNCLASQIPELLFSLNGISKLMGLPQLKLSWIIVQGNTQLASDSLKRLDIIADTFLSVNSPVQIALPKLFRYSTDIREQILTRVRTNYQQLLKTFVESVTTVMQTEGGWYAVLHLPQRYGDEEWAERILTHHNVLVQPGYFYDMEQKSCIVISLLPDSNIFKDTLLQLWRFIEES
jgi:alanine-synthesizing transaminase